MSELDLNIPSAESRIRSAEWSQLSSAAWLALVSQLADSLVITTILRQGLETNPDLLERFTFLAHQEVLWISGWLVSQFASLAFFYFFVSFIWAHKSENRPSKHLLWLVLILITVAVAQDLAAHAIEMGVLPGLAELALPELAHGIHGLASAQLCLTVHRIAELLTGYLSNGLYAVSALLLVWSTRKLYPPWVWIPGLAVGLSGLVFSVACLANSLNAMLWANVFVEPFSLMWQAGVAICAGRWARAALQKSN